MLNVAEATAARARLQATERLRLLPDSANATLHEVTVPALRPFPLVSCTDCPCDICAMVGSLNVFAPVESLLWEHVLSTAACDGSRAVVDVGANVGYFSALASRYDCVARVVALEPNAAPRLLANASLLLGGAEAAGRVLLLPFAVASRHGAVTLDGTQQWGLTAVEPLPGGAGRAKSGRFRPHALSLAPGARLHDDYDAMASAPPGSIRAVPLASLAELSQDRALLVCCGRQPSHHKR